MADEPHFYAWVRGWRPDHNMPLPAYTSSLDAAMTLVPEGMHYLLCSFDPDTEERQPCAFVGYPRTKKSDVNVCRASTLALALCAAALRAHLRDEEND